MTKTERVGMIESMVHSLAESVKAFEHMQDVGHKTPLAGMHVEMHDSKESMQRRIVCIREELNLLNRQIGGEEIR